MKVLLVRCPTFSSALDEELFFLGLRLSQSLKAYRGVGPDLRLVLYSSLAENPDLVGVLKRYKVFDTVGPPRASRRPKKAKRD